MFHIKLNDNDGAKNVFNYLQQKNRLIENINIHILVLSIYILHYI